MNKKQFELRMAEYLNGEMPAGREAEFRDLLRRRGLDPDLPSEYKRLFDGLDPLDVPEPGPGMDREYRALVEEYRADLRRRKWSSDGPGERRGLFFPAFGRPFRLAATLGLFLVGVLIGSWWTSLRPPGGRMSDLLAEVRGMKKTVIMAMLTNPSATERMKAVRISQETEGLDDEVIQALLETLDYDPNVNIRLVAAETLAGLAQNPAVRQGLVVSLERQESPLVQLALADILLALGEKRAVSPLDRLLQQKDLDYGIKLRLEKVRQRLI